MKSIIGAHMNELKQLKPKITVWVQRTKVLIAETNAIIIR